MQIADIERALNEELGPPPEIGDRGPHWCYLNVRYMGAGKWVAQLMNAWWQERMGMEPASAEGSSHDEAVEALCAAILEKGEVFRQGEGLGQKGTKVTVSEPLLFARAAA